MTIKTVGDLIAHLQQFDNNLEVYHFTCGCGFTEIAKETIKLVSASQENETYYTNEQIASGDDLPDDIKEVLIFESDFT